MRRLVAATALFALASLVASAAPAPSAPPAAPVTIVPGSTRASIASPAWNGTDSRKRHDANVARSPKPDDHALAARVSAEAADLLLSIRRDAADPDSLRATGDRLSHE